MDNNEKKKKIKMLEEEIELMQKDHAETFGYKLPKKIKLTTADAVIFIVGIVMLLTGLIWAACNISFLNGLAVFNAGGVRFFRSIYSLPLVIGTASLILCKRKLIPAAITAVGLAVSLIETFMRPEFSHKGPVSVIIIIVTALGAAMICYAAAKALIKEHMEKDE